MEEHLIATAEGKNIYLVTGHDMLYYLVIVILDSARSLAPEEVKKITSRSEISGELLNQ